ncbi:MAG TPA: hypothetical protein VIJ59_03675 [Caulobacteraceae bacterium]
MAKSGVNNMSLCWNVVRLGLVALATSFVLSAGVSLADAQAGGNPVTAASAAPSTSGSTAAASNPTAAGPVSGSYDAKIEAVGAGRATLSVDLPTLTNTVVLQLPTRDLRGAIVDARAGDTAQIEVDDALHPTRVTKITDVARPVQWSTRFWAMALSALGFALVLCLLTGFRPQTLLLGADKRYSNSQVQFALWFGAVAIVYVAAIGLRILYLGTDFIGGVGLPQNLIVLTGFSAFTFGGAKVIAAQKVASAATAQAGVMAQGAAAQAAAVNNAVAAQNAALPAAAAPMQPIALVSPIGVKTVSDKGAGLGRVIPDLTQNDNGDADLGDVQMILVAMAAVILFLLTAFHFLGRLEMNSQIVLPDVDTALLSIFGLGQGAYLVKKAALPLGQG